MFRPFVLALAVLGFLSVGARAAQAQVKIAYVDMQRALLEVEEGKAAKGRLEKMKGERQKDLDTRQEELRQLQANFEAQKAFMKDDVRRQKEDEFREKLGQLQMTFAKLQKELAAEEAKLTKDIFARMGRILQQMGERDGWTMIFEKTESSLLWAERSLDLTNELIRRYNAGEGRGGGETPPAAPAADKKGKK